MFLKHSFIIFASACLVAVTRSDDSSEEHPSTWDDYWDDHWEEFDELVKTGAYVDKTPLLKWFIPQRRHLALLAPSKLGRTTNQLMIRRFFEAEILPLDEKYQPTIKKPETWDQTVFKDLAVCKDRKFCNDHFRKYPVIYLDFSDLNTTTELSFYHSIRFLTTYMWMDHDYLRNSKSLSEKEHDKFIKYRHPRGGCEMPDDFVARGGWLLSVWLQKHFNKTCIVLIDNFESPAEFLMNVTDIDEKKKRLKLIRPLQDFVVKLIIGNNRVHHSLFIGKRRIDDYLTKEMTSLVYQPLFESAELRPYYGFSEVEVKDVIKRFKRTNHMNDIIGRLTRHKTSSGETVYSAFSMHDWCEAEEKAKKKLEKKKKRKRRDVAQPHSNDRETFEEVVRSGGYVDKSRLIDHFISQRKHLVILAPRRFGKSLNMEMLRKFVEIPVNQEGFQTYDRTSGNYSTFNELAVCADKNFCHTHYAAHPAIYMDFYELDLADSPGFYNSFRQFVFNLFIQHDYLKASQILDPEDFDQFNDYRYPKPPMSDEHIAYGPYVLTRLMATHFKKSCMVFIDNFDWPAAEMMQEQDNKFKNVVMRALNYLVKDLIKSKFVSHSLFSAVDFIAPRDLPELTFVPVLEDEVFGRFYGFREVEILDLLSRFNALHQMDEVKRLFYGGYKFKNGTKVYRAFSVERFLEDTDKRTTMGVIDGS